jgi:hypothetical protein
MVTIGNIYERRNANGDILYPSHSGNISNSERRCKRMKDIIHKKSTALFGISLLLTVGEVITYIIACQYAQDGE